jgi:hypothetical protein
MLQRSTIASGARLALAAGIALAAAGSASSNRNSPPQASPYQVPPPGASMAAEQATGLWRTSFGPVKIEVDDRRGNRYLMGVWVYERAGQEVIGYFSGQLDGNVLQFQWHEPGDPQAMVGAGYLVFDPQGASFNGKWWTESRDRSGDWSGWRHEQEPAYDDGYGADSYGGDTYGGDPYDGYVDPSYDDGYDRREPPPAPPPGW